MRRRFLSTVWALALMAGFALLAGCRSEPPVSAPVPASPSTAWQPRTADAQHRLDGFRAYMRRSYPRLGLEHKNDLWNTALEYVQWLGLEADSQSGTARIEDTLSSLVPAPEETSSRWLLKGTLRSRGPESTPPARAFYGVAVLTRTNGQVALGVDSPQGTFAFRGEERKGRLQGQVTFASGATCLTGKGQGTLTPERISLTVRGRSGKEAVQGELLLLR